MNTNNSYNDSEIEIDLKKIYLSLKKGIRWLIVTPVIVVLIAIIYVLLIAKPVYKSEAKILLANGGNSESSFAGLASQFGISNPFDSGEVSYLSTDNLPEILKSRTLTKSILFSEFQLLDYNEPRTYFEVLFNENDVARNDSNKLIAKGLKHIRKKVIKKKEIANTNIFHIIANTPEPALSAQVVSKIVNELEKLQTEFNNSELNTQKEFINTRLITVQGELFNAESRLKYFREQNLQINLSPTLMLDQERLQREIAIQTQLYISLKQESEQIKIEENKKSSSIKVIDEPYVPVYRSKPKRKLTVLLAGLTGLILGSMISLFKFYNE